MKKITYFGIVLVLLMTLSGCGSPVQIADEQIENNQIEIGHSGQENGQGLEDGTYIVEFQTDSSMFHVNEACEGKADLIVQDGRMIVHITLTSKNIVNLYRGMAADAEIEGAEVLEPTIDSVTYSDGLTEEVHGFDVPVPYLNQEFDLALLGKKGKWYDHKVMVTNPILVEE